jgi:hypothetical protein
MRRNLQQQPIEKAVFRNGQKSVIFPWLASDITNDPVPKHRFPVAHKGRTYGENDQQTTILGFAVQGKGFR